MCEQCDSLRAEIKPPTGWESPEEMQALLELHQELDVYMTEHDGPWRSALDEVQDDGF